MRRVGGLAAVGECALPGGFRATVLTLSVFVIDVAILAVASEWVTDTLVVRWERLRGAVVGCSFDGSHVLAEGAPINVVQAGVGY